MVESFNTHRSFPISSVPDPAGPRGIPAPLGKSFKRRATTACSFCQWRKIRCNVEESNPCSNCAIEKIDCQVTKRRKTKQDKIANTGIQQSQLLRCDQLSANIVLDGQGVHPQQLGDAITRQDGLEKLVDDSLPTLDNVSQPTTTGDSLLQVGTQPESSFSDSPSLHSGPSPTTHDHTVKKPPLRATLPNYIEPIPAHLSPDDIEYLHRKGSFDIPSDEFRNAALRSYAQFVHPYMPLFDIDDFLTDILGLKGRSCKVSLLVFQAVMFAGTAHVDIKPLRMMGFLTRKAARQALYERTKALYHLEYERNRIHVVQALVLMALWYQTPDDQQDAYHWLQIALSLARRASLDRNPACMNMPEDERRLRRKVWWCCLIRDPLLALGLKRPVSILPADHDVPELTLDDWDDDSTAHDGLSGFGIDWNLNKLRLLRTTCITQAKLHQCLSKIMSTQYVMGDYHRGRYVTDQNATRAILLPVTTDQTWRTMAECEENLRFWRENLPLELISTTVSPDSPDTSFDAFLVFRTVLHMIYHTCVITLYRPWTRPAGSLQSPSPASSQQFQTKIQTAIRMSAKAITDLALELHKLDLARHLPQTGLSALIAAAISHISDLASGDRSLRESASRGFEQCSHMLNELRENYYSADFTSDLVNLIAQAKKLTMVRSNGPIQIAQPHSFDFEDQSSATKVFLAADDLVTTTESTKEKFIRQLPEALFPQGTSLTLEASTDNQDPVDWNFEDSVSQVEKQSQRPDPVDALTTWEYYGIYREESARLLGDIFDEYQFNVFNSGQGIDLAG